MIGISSLSYFWICVPFCCPFTFTCCCASTQSSSSCQALKKNLLPWHVFACYPKNRDILFGCCRRQATTKAGQDCRARRKGLKQPCQKAHGRLWWWTSLTTWGVAPWKGPMCENAVAQGSICSAEFKFVCFLISYWAVGIAGFQKQTQSSLWIN